jgi:predicted nucleic acid-binding protein
MYLFDTMIVSYLLRSDPLLVLYQPELESGRVLAISDQSIAEIYCGASLDNWGEKKRAKIAQTLKYFTAVSTSAAIATVYGDIRARSIKIGRTLSPQLAWIMATAKHLKISLVSHDKDMKVGVEFGIDVINRT